MQLLIASLLLTSCGNYCGAWICGGGLADGTCDYSVEPVDWDSDKPSCVDACCR